jgi:4-hydroxy-4-methyl-2-oxoglutarate aldolase
MCELGDRLQKAYSGVVFDVMRAMGYADCILPRTIRPLLPAKRIAGQVFTVNGRNAPGINEKETLLEWCRMLSAVPPDTVLVCQPNNDGVSHMGELSSETLQFKKVRGYIVDGGCRDSGFIESIGFPVWCRYYTPVDIVSRWIPSELNGAITIGGIVIHPGDYAFADRDGIAIIPNRIAHEVADNVDAMLQRENMVRAAILRGVDPVDAYLKYGKF